ncbi:hypothetical protein HYPSUDRAFT_35497 [Hypholoma sublateritium FD-334 SS-4]|uniref:Uncharacterized protein n=1 Tax=Hypholoma sublateritium (strain FD-334 SS-4) TaxID=945553 RepID=A0A0D2Q5Y1_HYPSF|nr:hypothetical protein HYPSUDRAFT_35497 [Hypholoma sublateritium FD-334 SS-4]
MKVTKKLAHPGNITPPQNGCLAVARERRPLRSVWWVSIVRRDSAYYGRSMTMTQTLETLPSITAQLSFPPSSPDSPSISFSTLGRCQNHDTAAAESPSSFLEPLKKPNGTIFLGLANEMLRRKEPCCG